MTTFKQEPACEICKAKTANSFVVIGDKDDSTTWQWQFSCGCVPDNEIYRVEHSRIFASPAGTVDWLAHLHEKTWMNWKDFMDMMTRFRHATSSYHLL